MGNGYEVGEEDRLKSSREVEKGLKRHGPSLQVKEVGDMTIRVDIGLSRK